MRSILRLKSEGLLRLRRDRGEDEPLPEKPRDAGYTYSLGIHIKAERRFMGVFQDVMIYPVKLGMEDKVG